MSFVGVLLDNMHSNVDDDPVFQAAAVVEVLVNAPC
jgi:hypothetical protein